MKKIIDSNGRLFGKISVIDVVVLLVVVCMGAALFVKTNSMTHTSVETRLDTITYQVICHGIPTFVQDHLRVGDELFDGDNLTVGSLGKIIDIKYEDGTELAKFDDGTVVFAPKEDSVNIILTVQGSGLVSGNNYQLNRIYPLGVNANRNFCTRYTAIRGIVSSIEK